MSGQAEHVGIADRIKDWAPEPVDSIEVLDPAPADAFAGLLDQPSPISASGSGRRELPPLWTGFYFLERPATAELGEDGHPRDGHFLPPIPNRRRMFAGGRLAIHAPLLIGDKVVRRSTLRSVTPKAGRSGEMLFVTISHEYLRDGVLVQLEEHDLVYRQQSAIHRAPAPGPARRNPEPASESGWRVVLRPDEVLLFRMSALTYNAHRIHHDLLYAREVEGFPDLVVHGPLLALLLLELPRRFTPQRRIAQFSYRLRRPAFAGSTLVATARPGGVDLACGAAGADPSITGALTFT